MVIYGATKKKPYQLQRSEESMGAFLSLGKPQEVLAAGVLEDVEDGTEGETNLGWPCS
jgi:hypothetical protein